MVFPFYFTVYSPDGCLHDFPSSVGKYAWVGLSLTVRDIKKFSYYFVLSQRVKSSASFFLGTGKCILLSSETMTDQIMSFWMGTTFLLHAS